jgi:hypothetical protein
VQHAHRQQEDGLYQFQHSDYSNADDSDWQQDQPHDWIENQRDERQRPAENKKNAEEQKFDHHERRLTRAGRMFVQPNL